MEERFDRLEKMIGDLGKRVEGGFSNTANSFRAVSSQLDVHSRQIAGLSARIDSLTRDQKKVAAQIGERLEKVEAKAEITIEGHEAIRSEMHREFANLRRDIDLRVQPIEVAMKKRRSV